MSDPLTHFDEAGASRMVDVGDKAVTSRTAIASGVVEMAEATMERIRAGGVGKGDVIEVARLAGIMAAKRTWELIPLCHQLPLTSVSLDIVPHSATRLGVSATCKVDGKTGVEMEALTAVSVACLTIYDMCKAMDRGMSIQDVRLDEKTGGRSGTWSRNTTADSA